MNTNLVTTTFLLITRIRGWILHLPQPLNNSQLPTKLKEPLEVKKTKPSKDRINWFQDGTVVKDSGVTISISATHLYTARYTFII